MDEFERIRRSLGVPEADDAAKARALERLRRELADDRSSGTPGIRSSRADHASRPPHRRRYVAILGVAATLAFLAIVLQVILPTGRGGPQLTAASELQRLAGLSATIQPITPGKGFLYTDVESRGIQSNEDLGTGIDWDLVVRERLQTWIAADGSGRQVTTTEEVSFASLADRTRWIRAGRQPLPKVGSTVDRYGPGGLANIGVSSLPTDPEALREAIRSGDVIEEPAGPLGIFTGVGDILAQPDTPPGVRRALFELAAEIPGITLQPSTTDPLGRPGEGFTFQVGSASVNLIIDPVTARLLATVKVDDQGRTSWVAHVRDAALPSETGSP